MHDDGLPRTRPIVFSPSPFRQRSQSSELCAAVNPTRMYFFLIAITPPPTVKVKCCLDQLNPPSIADLQRHAHLRPLLRAKQTFNVRFLSPKRSCAGTSEGGGRADAPQGLTDELLCFLVPCVDSKCLTRVCGLLRVVPGAWRKSYDAILEAAAKDEVKAA